MKSVLPAFPLKTIVIDRFSLSLNTDLWGRILVRSMIMRTIISFLALVIAATAYGADTTNSPSSQVDELLNKVAPDFLRLSYYFLAILITCGSIVAIVFIRKIESSRLTDLLTIVANGDALKILATVLIVGSATLLAVFGLLKESTVAAILSGVAGYVLGTYGKGRTKKQADEEVAIRDNAEKKG